MQETNFKIIFLTLFIISNSIRYYYHFKKKKSETAYYKNKTKETLMVVLVYICFIIPTILYVFTDKIDIFSINLPRVIRFIGIIIIILGSSLLIYTHIKLGKLWSPVLEIRKNHHLIKTGIYKKIRHPMYSAIYIQIIGFWILSSNWIVGIISFLGFSILYFSRIKSEEKMMISNFGGEYEEYIKNTGRLFPKLILDIHNKPTKYLKIKQNSISKWKYYRA